MAEHSSDLYEQQLFAVFESCLSKGEDELDEENLFSICNKLHLDELIEELKLCICKHHPNKQTISFQEFRDGLLLLLKKSQGLMSTKQHTVQQPYYNLNMCNVDVDKSQDLPSVMSLPLVSRAHPRDMKAGVRMDENRLIHLWEKIKVYLMGNADPATIQFISNCLEIPQLPKQITESIFESLDHNCDGLISFDEFVIIFQTRTSRGLTLRENVASRSSITNINCDINTLDFNTCPSHKISLLQTNGDLDKKIGKITGVSSAKAQMLSSSSGALDALNTSLAEITTIVCDELKNLNESLDNSSIQAHISLLREMMIVHQDEQRNLIAVIENMKVEREKMRTDTLEANERANSLAQEIDEYHIELEKIRKDMQRQSEQRYAEITKELSDQYNMEREMDAAALKSKDDQLQTLQKENHDMKNKVVNILRESQMLEAENKTLLSQIEKLRLSNNDLLTQIKVLDAEHDEIQNIETKQQEQVTFFVDRIKQLQSEVTLLRDQNDELNAELENLKCYGKGTRYETPSSLAYDLQLDENQRENDDTTQGFQVDRQISNEKASFIFALDLPIEAQTDFANSGDTLECKRDIIIEHVIVKDLENVLSTSAKCLSEKCALTEGISRLIVDLRSKLALRCPARDSEKSIACELEMECEQRTNESLRDLVISKIPKSSSTKRTTMSNSAEAPNNFTGQDAKNLTQNKVTSLRDYPPRKEEHSVDQCKANKERNGSSNIPTSQSESQSVSKIAMANAELLEIEKKQLTERCQELERSLDLLKAEYEECEDYWAAKLEEERQLFEQEQKISDDKLVELINKITEYEELISPSDKSKNNGRLSPIEEKFNLEQQYIDLEEEFEKWKIQTENDIFQKNLEIGDLREKLRLVEQPITNDFYVQVPDEISLPTFSDSSHCKSSSISSILSTNETFINMDLCGTNSHTWPEFSLSNNLNRLCKQDDNIDSHTSLYTHTECPIKIVKSINKDKNIHHNNPHLLPTKTMLAMKEENKCDLEFKLIHDVTKETSDIRSQNNAQRQVGCVDLNIFQNLKMKFYTQERKKRHLQRYIKQQRQYIEKLLQHIMMQHQMEVCELQCLLRNTQERLQIQVQTTIDQADKLASADILVKDLYIENACLTSHMKRLQERYFILTGLDVESTSM
ncbi:ninein [Monomorium pharaonis]|uniref:ninein n=1 Tax=Monomorium pharaonis TaxID=307658 RepID=UPI00063F4FDE|nr:ninein [Monomorium pharaonis]XP_028044807.1 ninein [Monomorium pharaonis]XP_036149541.1 ninein [Monomorium pharaonis]